VAMKIGYVGVCIIYRNK